MNNKNHYPLRHGKGGDQIVSDVSPRIYMSSEEAREEVRLYGGHLLAESVPRHVAEQIIAAYNEKYGCTDGKKACIGGQMCCQSKISHHSWVAQENSAHSFTEGADVPAKEVDPDTDYMDIRSPKGTKVTVSYKSIKNGSDADKARAEKFLKVGNIYTVARTVIHTWTTDVHLDEFPGISFNSVQFVKVTKTAPDRLAFNPKLLKKRKEELESSAMPPSIDHQIQSLSSMVDRRTKDYSITRDEFECLQEAVHNLIAIKRYSDIDLKKVIEDLLKVITIYEATGSHNRPVSQTSAIQNAEAALGMLQAFKPERDPLIKTWTPEEVRKAMAKQPLHFVKKEFTQEQRDEIVSAIARQWRELPDPHIKPSFQKANTIMFAIESVLNAKGL